MFNTHERKTMRLLYFSQPTCPPCRLMSAVVDNVIIKMQISVDLINAADHEQKDRTKYNVTGTPTVILVDDKYNELHRWVGLTTEDKLINKIKELSNG